MTNDSFVIEGLGGKKTLSGVVSVNGAKNAALKAMASAVLFDGPVILKNVPFTEDIKKLATLLTLAGAVVSEDKGKKTMVIDTSSMKETTLDAELAKSMRASVVLTGPMLTRFGKVVFPAPGGCVIGARPIDLFIDGYRKMGAVVELVGDSYVITAKKLKGTEIFFNIQTVGGTETLMMAAVLASGTTVLKNCAMEPEIVSIAEFLNACGAKIKGAGTPTIEIEGVGGLLSAGKRAYVTIPDRIEAGSFLFLGALCADNLKITDCRPDHLESVMSLLRQSGVDVEVTDPSTVTLSNNAKVKNSSLKTCNVRTHEYPGFPTDLQAPIVTYLTQVSGEGIVFETIYEGRFKYIQNLEKLGASITVMNPREILVRGGNSFRALEAGESLDAYDIRAGFATVMAALVAKGNSVIQNVHLIDRGYEDLETRLGALGANVRRVHGESI